MTKKRALISVYNKDKIVYFAKKLVEDFDYEIISTGGTYQTLKENGINAIEISEITGFTELLGGKVKSLHPKIHAAILASRTHQDELAEIKNQDIHLIDLVVVNLYPFEEASKDYYIDLSRLIEFIDIGGVTLLRSAAKNFFYVTPVYSPDLYEKILDELNENNGNTSYELRKELAISTFQYTSTYDSIISEQFYARTAKISTEKLPDILNLNLNKIQDLRYGENPHQKAALYNLASKIKFELLQGKELSYNNFVDLTSAMNIISEFIDIPTACIIKHNNPCGVALGDNIFDAYIKAFDCDPISAFGGIIGFNEPVNKEIANHVKEIFFEVIVAPDFTAEALEILKVKKNLRLVKVPINFSEYRYTQKFTIKDLPFGVLVQTADKAELSKDNFQIVTSVKPTEKQIEDMIFAWKVAKHVSSNAIVIAKDKQTVGIGVGQTSRIASMEIALAKACDKAKDAVIASDGFFPATDNIYAAAQARISAIIQPGGSIKDKDVTAEAEKYNTSMIFTSIRHFKH
ncbi:MAG: bifunctional phosphoribosylaminoimidazolecarboxamide formyltransferase/IMP cyclohydrolase [bacterium]